MQIRTTGFGVGLLLALAACSSAPTGPLDGRIWVLTKVDGAPLPARQIGFVVDIIADTLRFGVSSSKWNVRPLARAIRWIRGPDAASAPRSEDWWYTYGDPAGGDFAFRGLCDDTRLASCINTEATASLGGDVLTIRFQTLGVLEYHRLQ
jgi:hypothetical protein